MTKPEAAVLLIRRALAAGIQADYVLMDTWFTTEPMLIKILDAGLDVIGSIECFFKASKSFLKLGTEFQSRTYDAMVATQRSYLPDILYWNGYAVKKTMKKPVTNYSSCFVMISKTWT